MPIAWQWSAPYIVMIGKERPDPGWNGLAASAGAGERDQRDVASPLYRHGQRALVTGACSQLPARLDLAALANVPPEARDVLVVNVPDVVDAERADLPSGSVTPASRSPATGPTTWTTTRTVAIAPLALRATET